VGDQGLGGRQFQLELVSQENRQALLDLLGFGYWPGKAEQGVVGVTAIAQPPVTRIIRVLAGEAVQPLVEGPHLSTVAPSTGLPDRSFHLAVLGVASPEPASGVLRYENCLDENVQLVQVDVGKDGRGDAPCGTPLRVAPHAQSSR
jgi:hypothetical protein